MRDILARGQFGQDCFDFPSIIFLSYKKWWVYIKCNVFIEQPLKGFDFAATKGNVAVLGGPAPFPCNRYIVLSFQCNAS